MSDTRGTDVIEYVASSIYQGYTVPLVELSDTEKAILALPHALTGMSDIEVREERREYRHREMAVINSMIKARQQ